MLVKQDKLLKYCYCIIAALFISLHISSCSHAQVPSANLKFPEGKDVVEIPFVRDRGWIVVKAIVNDTKELSFMLDTGAPIAILVEDKLADQLKLNIHGNISVKGSDANAPKSCPLARDVKFNIGGIKITNGLMAIGATTAAVSGIDGIIGKYFFEDAVIRIDWKQNKLIVTRPEKFSYHGNGEVLPVTSANNGHFFTDVSLKNGESSTVSNADIDLGNVSSYFFIHKSDGLSQQDGRSIPNIITGWGANGPSYGNISRASLKVGSFLMDSVVTVYKNTTANDEVDGNIGIALLERFDPIFDYPHHQLILEKNNNFSKPFTFNQSGIILNPRYENDHMVIAGIIPNSPAQDEGLKTGDHVISLNGTNIDQLSRSMIKELVLGMTSSEIELQVKRGENLMNKKIKLRKLI